MSADLTASQPTHEVVIISSPRSAYRVGQRLKAFTVHNGQEEWRPGEVTAVVWQPTVRTFAVTVQVAGAGVLRLPVRPRASSTYLRPRNR